VALAQGFRGGCICSPSLLTGVALAQEFQGRPRAWNTRVFWMGGLL
jgi:hypothetical protein